MRFMAEKIEAINFVPKSPAVTSFRPFMAASGEGSGFATVLCLGFACEDIVQAGRTAAMCAANAFLDQGHAMYPLMRHWCQLMYSMDPADVSTGDAGNYSDSHVNLPVKAGYGALVARLANELAVSAQHYRSKPLKSLAKTFGLKPVRHGYLTKACIVAVPARQHGSWERITFKPGLPAL